MPKDDALIAELTAPTYAFTSTGKMVVESKADMKKRGMRSHRGLRSCLPAQRLPR
jgi:phage terminase large subunit